MKRTLAMVVVLALLGVIACFIQNQRLKPQTTSLPDGSQLTLLQVTHGTNHVCVYSPWWQDLLDSLRARFGVKAPRRRATFTSAETNSVMVWLRHDPPAPGLAWPPPYFLSVADENNLESKLRQTPNVRVNLRAAFGRPSIITGWELPEHPRRAKEFRIRLYLRGVDGTPARIAELTVRNPASGKFPIWQADPLPATRRTDKLEITLTKLETGLTAEEAGIAWVSEGGRSLSRATFTVKEHGVPTGIWGVSRLRASNAAGEVRRCRTSNLAWQNDQRIITFEGALWLDESAWKLEVAFVRNAAYPLEEHWVIKGVPVPRPGELVEMHLVTNLFNVELEFVGVSGANAKMSDNHIATQPHAKIHVRSPHPMDDLRVALVEVKDDLGSSAILNGFSSTVSAGGRGITPKEMLYEFGFDLPAEVKSLDITLAATRIVTVAFLAKPALTQSLSAD
jgi:hypothetical protein